MKFSVRRTHEECIAFAVSDTGIGIAEDQQEGILDAFRQADSALAQIWRYWTGPFHSRELARLLGGTIASCESGRGSTFTATVPLVYDVTNVLSRQQRSAAPYTEFTVAAPALSWNRISRPQAVGDDRDRLLNTKRILLVIEDDEAFAGIVCGLSRSMGFQCIVAGTAEEALRLARQFKPNAVVLDIGLPDQSGLTVLDRLKRDDETRHIPVHVISGTDHTQTALSLGAIGYVVKPIKPRSR